MREPIEKGLGLCPKATSTAAPAPPAAAAGSGANGAKRRRRSPSRKQAAMRYLHFKKRSAKASWGLLAWSGATSQKPPAALARSVCDCCLNTIKAMNAPTGGEGASPTRARKCERGAGGGWGWGWHSYAQNPAELHIRESAERRATLQRRSEGTRRARTEATRSRLRGVPEGTQGLI